MTVPTEDPLLRNSRREAVVVTCFWLVAMFYTVGYCAWNGYGDKPLTLVLGFPAWVFWGIVTPWGVCVVGGILFAYFYMKDDDIRYGEIDDPDAAEENASA